MEPLVIWLLWTFQGPDLVDVDAFIHEAQCNQTKIERQDIVKDAIKQTGREELKAITMRGCYALPTTPPQPA